MQRTNLPLRLADFNRPSLVETFVERRTEGNCSFTTMRSPIFDESAWRHYRRRNGNAIRSCRLSDEYVQRNPRRRAFRLCRSRQPMDENRPNSATNGYYSTWQDPLRSNRLSLAPFDTTPEIDGCIAMIGRFRLN